MLNERDDHGKRDHGHSMKFTQLQKTLFELRPEALKPGFFGSVEIVVKLQGGVIQHVVTRVEESIR